MSDTKDGQATVAGEKEGGDSSSGSQITVEEECVAPEEVTRETGIDLSSLEILEGEPFVTKAAPEIGESTPEGVVVVEEITTTEAAAPVESAPSTVVEEVVEAVSAPPAPESAPPTAPVEEVIEAVSAPSAAESAPSVEELLEAIAAPPSEESAPAPSDSVPEPQTSTPAPKLVEVSTISVTSSESFTQESSVQRSLNFSEVSVTTTRTSVEDSGISSPEKSQTEAPLSSAPDVSSESEISVEEQIITPEKAKRDDAALPSILEPEVQVTNGPVSPDTTVSDLDTTSGSLNTSISLDFSPPATPASTTATKQSKGRPVSSISEKITTMGDAPTPGTSGLGNYENFDNAVTISHRSSVDSGTGSDPVRNPGHFVVVAIDFGTTFSGYAFSFARDPHSIHMMRKWEGGDPGVVNQKIPTTILLDPDGKFHSFGFTARDYFHDLDPKEAKKWMYFEKFKMALHYNADLNKETMIKATNGKLFPAMKIFSFALKFFKNHALQELSDQSATKIINEDVKWVITVPAIWKAPAKQFMRVAAFEAGIASPEFPDQLLIALEPEAASIYCRRLRMHQLVPDIIAKRPLSPKRDTPEPMNMDVVGDDMFMGTRYMVVDCGGGTVDITVHEMEQRHGKLKELYKATGGPYGSVGVDVEFEKLLVGIFGSDFIEMYKYKRPAGFVDLMIAFESRKRAASPFKNNPLNVSLPFSFIDCYKKYKFGGQVESAIRKFGDKDILWSTQGMLRLTRDAMRRLFQPTLERIKMAIGDVLNNPSVKDIKYLFLVGGFAESPILQNEVRREFGHLLKMIIPQDVGLTILKGAVCFGLDPTVVNIRRSRHTYGVGVLNRYNKDKHPKDKLITKDGVKWCTDVFDKFVRTDQSVALGDSVLRSYTPAKPGQKSSVINIYCADREDVQFITDPGVRKCGTLCLDLSETQYQQMPRRREIQTRMIFGDTEIKLSALDVATGKIVKAAIDFLNK